MLMRVTDIESGIKNLFDVSPGESNWMVSLVGCEDQCSAVVDADKDLPFARVLPGVIKAAINILEVKCTRSG